MIHSGKTDCAPEEVDYNPQTLDLLYKHFQDLIQKKTIHAAGYLLAKNGKVFAHKSMGKLSVFSDKREFLPDSIRPIASITKLFTATGILQLMEQGKLFLTQPVSSILKEFDTEMHRYINIFQLLTHTSGLSADPGAFFEPYTLQWYWENCTKEDWIKKALAGPLQFKPGTTWNYCTSGFQILAEVIARVSGMDYDEYIMENIFKPLAMDDSFYFVPDSKKSRICIISEWNRERLNEKRTEISNPSLLGGGGAFSTLKDLWKFGQMMLNGGIFNGNRILGRKTVEAATKPQKKDIIAYNWRPHIYDYSFKWTCGLGWEINKHSFLSDGTYDHEGAEGAGLFIDPQENFIFAGFYPSVDWYGESWINPLAIAWSGIK